MAHKQPGYRFENDWDEEMSNSDATHVVAGIALPVYEEIKLNNTVLNLDSVKQYLTKAKKIGIQNCPCRTKRKHCYAPLDVCIMLNDVVDWGNSLTPQERERKKFREVTVEEALEAVERAHAAGLVPMAYMRARAPRSTITHH